ncbi:phosphoribosylanthranilate isomerase [Serpentinicella sp. ANB-PHB4]|uniref:phosphoribosylanthranilate isomerase n=1 Tax=Serpentinicella sp. ANB-PHB4 TaxID=3074076 RepID=UPI002854A16F|nr:phosphoribosylanthranilate isomerase [Serpentinicella sp. ANB-PHB4]MDR5659157.1 phosphoribosylanthranilate isomerase [Serpentinicella sp. ANB-PHB4]
MTPKIKICGIQYEKEIQMINNYPIDYIGFVFAPSKRHVTPDKAKILISSLRKNIKTVGVFVNESSKHINHIVSHCNLDIIQLHGNENDDFCTQFIKPIWKSISIKNAASFDLINHYTTPQGFLLDASLPRLAGGTGTTFDWTLSTGFSQGHFIILAGGLNAENIRSAINIVRPHVIDVSSGVERNNMKCEKQIDTFVRRVKNHEIK